MVRHTGRSIWEIVSTFVSQLILANFWVENSMTPPDFSQQVSKLDFKPTRACAVAKKTCFQIQVIYTSLDSIFKMEHFLLKNLILKLYRLAARVFQSFALFLKDTSLRLFSGMYTMAQIFLSADFVCHFQQNINFQFSISLLIMQCIIENLNRLINQFHLNLEFHWHQKQNIVSERELY